MPSTTAVRTSFTLLLALLVLPGCDVFDSLEDADPVPVPVTSVRIAGIPEMPNRTTPWDDDGTGPDVFVEIQTPSGSSIGRSETVPDVDLLQPLTIPMPDDIETGSTTGSLYVVVYDADGNDRFHAQRIGESESFSVEALLGSSGSLLLLDSRVENGREATYELIR